MTTIQLYLLLIFNTGDPVQLAVPTARKLDPQWEGEWVIYKNSKSLVNVEIADGGHKKVVHTNRLQHHYIPGANDMTVKSNTVGDDVRANTSDWAPPKVDHLPPDSTLATP